MNCSLIYTDNSKEETQSIIQPWDDYNVILDKLINTMEN